MQSAGTIFYKREPVNICGVDYSMRKKFLLALIFDKKGHRIVVQMDVGQLASKIAIAWLIVTPFYKHDVPLIPNHNGTIGGSVPP